MAKYCKVSRSQQGSSELSAEEIICRERIPIPNGVWKETVLKNVSSIIWHLKCHWMLNPTVPVWGWRSSQDILALLFRPLNSNMSLLTLRLLWRDSHPNCSRMLVILPVCLDLSVDWSNQPLYTVSLTSWRHGDRLRFKKPRVLFAFVHTLLT